MKNQALFFALMTLLFLFIQSFYSMLEMSCVSFNKIRLQYEISQKKKRAIWLSKLIRNPTRLFGTTLIGVNAAMQFGSETARRFYAALDLNPDFAPLSQVILVLLFAELSPMFAGRRYAEHVTMLGMPLIYLSSILLAPIIWLLEWINRGVHKLFRVSNQNASYHLSRQELQKAIEGKDERYLSNLFTLREKIAKDLMIPMEEIPSLSSTTTTLQAREYFRGKSFSHLLLFQNERKNIVGVISPRNLLRLSSEDPIAKVSSSPWFITQKNSIFQILKQFRWNNQSLAIVLDEQGRAQGILTLDAIVQEVFHAAERGLLPEKIIDRTFPGEMLIEEVNKILHIDIQSAGEDTLEEILRERLGHHPAVGESIQLGAYELLVEEANLLEVQSVRVRTITF